MLDRSDSDSMSVGGSRGFRLQLSLFLSIGLVFVTAYVMARVILTNQQGDYPFFWAAWSPSVLASVYIHLVLLKEEYYRNLLLKGRFRLAIRIMCVGIANLIGTQLLFVYPVAFLIVGDFLISFSGGVILYANKFDFLGGHIKNIAEEGPRRKNKIYLESVRNTVMFWLKVVLTAMTVLVSVLGTAATIVWATPFSNFSNTFMSAGLVILGIYVGLGLYLWIALPLFHHLRNLLEALSGLRAEDT